MTFAADLSAFANKTHRNLNLVVKKIVIDIGTALVYKTPVGDPTYWISKPPPGYVGGRARGNWQYALDAPALVEFNRIDKNGQSTVGNIASDLPAEALGKVHYITNTLPYIKRLEEGHSKRQAPKGMVRLTTQEFEPIIAAAVRAIT